MKAKTFDVGMKIGLEALALLEKNHKLEKENVDLKLEIKSQYMLIENFKSKLANQKYLDRLQIHAKIWNLLGEANLQDTFIDQDENGEYIQNEETARLDICVDDICKLAISEQPKLDRVEAEKIIDEYICNPLIKKDEFITAIYNLAYNKKKIVEILKECFITGHIIGFGSRLIPVEWEEKATDYQKLCKQNLLNQWTKEIIGEDK